MSRARSGALIARLAAGPVAIAAFFADWMNGSGFLAGHRFSGFELVALTGNLQLLELSFPESLGLALLRAAILGVMVAATWQVVLAASERGRTAYVLSGWYITAAALLAGLLAIYQGSLPPPVGVLLLLAAAGCFLAGGGTHPRRPAGQDAAG